MASRWCSHPSGGRQAVERRWLSWGGTHTVGTSAGRVARQGREFVSAWATSGVRGVGARPLTSRVLDRHVARRYAAARRAGRRAPAPRRCARSDARTQERLLLLVRYALIARVAVWVLSGLELLQERAAPSASERAGDGTSARIELVHGQSGARAWGHAACWRPLRARRPRAEWPRGLFLRKSRGKWRALRSATKLHRNPPPPASCLRAWLSPVWSLPSPAIPYALSSIARAAPGRSSKHSFVPPGSPSG